jgi:hypothetical protein
VRSIEKKRGNEGRKKKRGLVEEEGNEPPKLKILPSSLRPLVNEYTLA